MLFQFRKKQIKMFWRNAQLFSMKRMLIVTLACQSPRKDKKASKGTIEVIVRYTSDFFFICTSQSFVIFKKKNYFPKGEKNQDTFFKINKLYYFVAEDILSCFKDD